MNYKKYSKEQLINMCKGFEKLVDLMEEENVDLMNEVSGEDPFKFKSAVNKQ